MSAAQEISPKPFQTSQSVKFKPADRNRRVVAFVIDAFIAEMLRKLLMFVVVSGMPKVNLMLGVVVGYFAVAFFYWTLLTLEFGATPGKKIMGIKIVTEKHKLKLGLGQIFFRETLGRFCSALPLMLGYIWVSFDKKERKTFHDMLAKTRVVDYR